MTNFVALREQFPVFSARESGAEGIAYLNAGTCGPMPSRAVAEADEVARWAAREGRSGVYYERFFELRNQLRERYAALVGAPPGDVAVTTSTSDGMVSVLLGLGLSSGDEVLIATDEHPGLLGPLAAARRALGVTVRAVPLPDLGAAVGPRTRLIACSHVGWVSGLYAPPELAVAAGEVPVLLDGAQGLGAVPVDVEALGCAFYAASGQKWLCGPVATGMLYIAPRWRERLAVLGPVFPNLAEPALGLDAEPYDDARALDAGSQSLESTAFALAAHDVLAAAGWPEIFDRARGLAASLADRLGAEGRVVAPRSTTTLVSWESDDPEAERDRLAAAGVVVRNLPRTPYVRASVGAWNDESDLDRLVTALRTAG